MSVNDNLVLVVGKSATGKSACLKDLPNHEGVIYMNCESGKKLPFPNKFKKVTITDPYQVYHLFEQAEQMEDVHTLVIDSVTFLMQMYEVSKVKTAANTMQAWGEYGDFFVNLMQQYVAKSTKNVIMTAHTQDQLNESTMTMETFIKVKGALMNNGIEAFFSQIVACKTIPLKDLEGQESEYLNITEDDEDLEYKHVFQTRKTKETTGERIRGPLGMWKRKETFIDNNIAHVLDRIDTYYKAL